MKNNKQVKYLRWGLLALFVVLISTSAYLHQVLGATKAPSIHALCPFGGLESLYQVFTTGSFVSKIFTGTMTLFVITLVVAILFRRSFCGLICPFGAIQEFFAKLGQKIFKRKMVVPSKLDQALRYLKYVVLAVTVFYAWKTAGLWMAPYDPWSAYAHLPEGLESVWAESAVGLIILVVTVLGSLIYDRFFCKYLCPVGALYGMVGKTSPFKVVRNESLCIDCGICNKVCPMSLDVQHGLKVTSPECMNCQTCVLNCPTAGALDNQFSNKIIKPFTVIILVLVLFFGSIFAAQATGIFELTAAPLKVGEFINYDEVKGYMSIKEAAESTQTDLTEFYIKFEIPENVPAETKMKEISQVALGYDFDKVKESLTLTTDQADLILSEPQTKVDLEGIKGSMTISDAAKTVKLDIEEFYRIFKLPENIPSNTYMKDIVNAVPGYDYHEIIGSLK
ncbi:4Fe-4S binding protein [Desulfosporosinus sp. BICA1-9]|uniref:4Fe-4S binding protein n=1 Tax=Desulfosporosinus sp. BICA1-9 TaxID=1531958 RepID=UPI00054C4D2A|nr:MAG: 4Fe-4S ferredoxin [Peptococcaceae bacterium BRH_c23]KJS82021.1 MAG: 4Fe-4S ferredoxin [Desulfosporosinus sp. BICA1-9]HBW35903.1 4Fe-4S binding protein [Desulfosporosinus sp.]